MTKKESASVTAGLMIGLGIPGIVWAFFDWKWALVVFVAGQLLISIAQLITSPKEESK